MKQQKYHFFWSGIFSQWYKKGFKVNGISYTSAEQYMMACKAALFDDYNSQILIMETDDCKKIKAIGRQVSNFDAKIWDKVAPSVVKVGNYAKFTQNPTLYQTLMDIECDLFVEASPNDAIWGIGMAANDPNIMKTELWGKNKLGRAITEVRDNLRKAKQNELY